MTLIRSILISLILSLFLITACDFPFPESEKTGVPDDHTERQGIALHKPGLEHPFSKDSKCTDCHGKNLKGDFLEVNGVMHNTPSCYQCHGKKWEN